MMKRILMSIMVGLVLGGLLIAPLGCCPKLQPDGTTKKVFSLACVQDTVCNADPTTVAAVNVFLDLVKPFIAAAAPGSQILLAYATAENIQKYGCAGITDLAALITFIQGFNTAQVAQARAAQAAGKKMAMTVIPVDPLINWKNSKK